MDLPGQFVPVEITMNEHLLAALDRAARASGMTRAGARLLPPVILCASSSAAPCREPAAIRYSATALPVFADS